MRHLHSVRRGAKAWLDIIGYLPGRLGADRQRGQPAVAADDGRQTLSGLDAAKVRVDERRSVAVAVGIDKARRHRQSRRVDDCINLGVNMRGDGFNLVILHQHIGGKSLRAGAIVNRAFLDERSHTSIPLAATFSLRRVSPS